MIIAPTAVQQKSPARTPYATLAILLVSSRLVILLIAGLSLAIINKSTFFTPPADMLHWFLRWDTGWYLSIAADGYSFHPNEQSSVAFFPFYPLLIGMLNVLVKNHVLSGYLISNFALYGSLVFLWRLIFAEYSDHDLATSACWFLLIGPVSFFFSTVYSESTFLFFSLGCLYFGRQRSWLVAGLLGYCASLTRNIGAFLFLPLLWEYYSMWRASPPVSRRINGYALICCIIPGLGLITYMAFLWLVFGDPLAFSHVQSTWARKFVPFWKVLLPGRVATMEPFFQYWFVGTVAVTGIALALGAWLRVSKVYLFIVLAPLILFLSTNNLESIPRYISVLFPLYLIAALLARKSAIIGNGITAFSLALQALSVIQFVNGYWFT